MSTIVTRASKGSALTWTEGDANITNLNNDKIQNIVEDLTPQLGGDLDVNGKNITSASNGNINITPNGSGNISLAPATGKIILGSVDWPTTGGTNGQVLTTNGTGTASWTTVSSGGISNLVEDTSPQLGGALDVNGQQIVSASNGNIAIVPNGSGNIQLTPATGKITLGAVDWPTTGGTNGQVLTTNGTGTASWATVSSGLTDIVNDTTPQLGGNLDVNGKTLVNTISNPTSIDITTKDITLTPGNTGIGNNGNVILSGLYFPRSDGTNTQVLATNGSGQLYWTAGGGSGTVTSVGGTGTVNGLSLSGTVTTSGNLTLSGTLDLSAPPAIGGTTPAAVTGTKLSLPSTAFSQASWTTNGVGLVAPARTYTDTTSTGTVANTWIHALNAPVIASTNTTTFTTASTLFLATPTAGTNTTITNAWALNTQGSVRVGRIYQQRTATQANWGTLGAQFTIDAATLTNSTSSGTVAAMYVNTFNTPTIAASSATTVTDNANLFVAAPVASTNMTFTNNWAILSSGNIKTVGLTVDTIQLDDIRETVFAIGASGASTLTPNAANGSVQTISATGNFTLSAFTSPVSGQTITFIITQDATGSRTLTSTMKFAGASKTLSTAANSIDILTVSYIGTTYYASLSKGFA